MVLKNDLINLFFILFAITTGVKCVDHSVFKNCSENALCSTLRTKTPQNKYSVDPSTISIAFEDGEATITLVSDDENLKLTINALQKDSLRIKIVEVDTSRYQLKDVLEGDPVRKPFDTASKGEDGLTLTSGTATVVVKYSPFNIEFYRNNLLEAVLLGDRLTFENDQSFTLAVSFPQAVQLYGIHEHADNLALQTTEVGGTDPYRLRNLDVAGYELNSPMALYGAVPVLYGHGSNATSGIFLHNAAEQWWEITNGPGNTQTYVMVQSGMLDLFVFLGPSPREVVRQYVLLTGTAHLPQFWTLGYHQCRYSYMTQEEVKNVVANFNNYNFPLDVMWLDVDYTDGKKYFTWNPENFSDPVEMQQNISATHKRLVTIIDPHIKVEEEYRVYDGALERDLLVKNSNGSNFQGECWPGLSSYMDFLNPEARDYFGSFYSYEKFPSSTPVLAGIWNDMNEPSVFNDSLEKTLPYDAVHYGNVIHKDIHNIYGFLNTMATHQGLMQRDNGTKRPFVLTRSHFAGSQRYAAIWTGDNTADWGYLSVSYSECLNANLLGIVFCGADVGGFFDNPDTELLQRWYQAGVWLPFYRGHANKGTIRREPYLFDESVQEVIRNAIQWRYRHLPVWYTLFYEHTLNKDPIVRPLFYQYPTEEETYALKDHLLVGKDILVRAVAEPGVQSVSVYFPGGSNEQWLSLNNNSEIYEGNGFVDIPVDIQAIPVYYRRGSIIVRKDTIRLSTDEMLDDDYDLIVNSNQYGLASTTLYQDDFTSFKYKTNNEYQYVEIIATGNSLLINRLHSQAKSENFKLSIRSVTINNVIKEPKNGRPGIYESRVYKRDVNNNLLSNLELKLDKPVEIQLA